MLDILLAYVFLAGGIVSNKYILASVSAEFFVALRMLISGTMLMLYNWYQVEQPNYHRVKKDWMRLFAIAACTTLVPALLKAWSLKHMLAGKQSLLGSIDPFITALMVYVLFHEKLSFYKIGGMIIGFVGVIIVVFSKSMPEVGYEFVWQISYPEIAILSAVIISRYGWILVQQLLKNKEYTPTQINGIVQIIAGALALGFATYNGCLEIYNITSYFSFYAAFLFTVIGGNIIGYTLYAHALKNYSATLVSLAGFSIPLLVGLFAYIFLGELITQQLILGGLVIFIGLSIFYFNEKWMKLPKIY